MTFARTVTPTACLAIVKLYFPALSTLPDASIVPFADNVIAPFGSPVPETKVVALSILEIVVLAISPFFTIVDASDVWLFAFTIVVTFTPVLCLGIWIVYFPSLPTVPVAITC